MKKINFFLALFLFLGLGQVFVSPAHADLQIDRGQNKSQAPIIFFVGPEKGFDEREIEILEKKFQATGVKLHSNILRTDTASLAALSLLN